jgi:hypothetical protein
MRSFRPRLRRPWKEPTFTCRVTSSLSHEQEIIVNFKMLMLSSFASMPLVVLPAMAQTETKPAPEVNTPDAHRSTTVTAPDGKTVQTPPVGMRSGDKNAGGN